MTPERVYQSLSFVILSTVTQRILAYAIALLLLRLLAHVFKSTKPREWLFLFASYLFYFSWGGWRFLAILIFSSLVNYALGIYLRRRLSAGRLWLGISFNLLLLSLFKYLPLVGVSAHNPALARLSHIALPVGVSFWTFQAISYLLDLYREEELDPSLMEFCLYMTFWPTVLSGPICRLPAMLPQFRRRVEFSLDGIGKGAQRMVVGIVMMALSELLASGIGPGRGVDAGFDRPAHLLGGIDVWLLAIGYGFQLFFNFAGYSHIVIGAARTFNIRLHENFERPYLSPTPSVFWARWHMSLSFWIRDYVFFPLATLRREIWWRNLSLVISMFVFGLWHKGSVLFMLWGIYHGLLLVAHRQWQQLQLQWKITLPEVLSAGLGRVVTFAAVSLGWIFFRAESGSQAASMFKTLLSPGRYALRGLSSYYYLLIVVVMIGYFIVAGVSGLLENQFPAEVEAAGGGETPRAGFVAMLARDRWIWVGPLLFVLSLYVLLVLRPERSLMAPMMYQIF